MNAKIERVCNEIEKTKAQLAELQAKLRELERKKTELENLEIIGTVRSGDISIADLAALLKSRTASGQIGPRSAEIETKEENE